MPGGVNSPVRAFRSVGGEPIYARRAAGAILETVDGRQLIDFCQSFGPMILGHAPPDVVDAIARAAQDGQRRRDEGRSDPHAPHTTSDAAYSPSAAAGNGARSSPSRTRRSEAVRSSERTSSA